MNHVTHSHLFLAVAAVSLVALLFLSPFLVSTSYLFVPVELIEPTSSTFPSPSTSQIRLPVDPSSDSESTCTLYLAESTIPNAGFGVYTTKAIKKNGIVQKADSASIVFFDMSRHQLNRQEPDWQHQNYFWSTHGQQAFEAYSTSVSVMNMGALSNFHTVLKSAGPSGEEKYDDTILDRFKDPGAGAISHHMGYDFVAKYSDIEANEEIFVDYGEHWLDARKEFNLVPRAQDFKNGEAAIALLQEFLDAKKRQEADRRISKTASGPNHEGNDIIKFASDIINIFSNRTSALIPQKVSDLNTLSEASGRELASSMLPKRTTEWITTNGRCLDNIIPKRSTISSSGNGGFARRTLGKGSTIVPVPVVIIHDRDILNIYDNYEGKNGEKYRKGGRLIGKQLLLNYCLGNGRSKLLLCPQTNSIMVNHCSTRRTWEGQCGREGPNAAFRWATDWDPSTVQTLNLTLEELSKANARGLSLELYATRDIHSGDEIFVDYGQEWEVAWTKHVKTWKPPGWSSNFKSYQSVSKLNLIKDSSLQLLSDKKHIAIPDNVLMGCIYWESESNWTDTIDNDDIENWKSFDDETILAKFGRSGRNFTRLEDGEDTYWPCKIYTKDESGTTGVVRILQAPFEKTTAWDARDIPRFLTDYQLNSVKFFHAPYKSDQHLPGAFRHHIGLSNKLMPKKWRT